MAEHPEALAEVLARMLEDGDFARAVYETPDEALAEFELSEDERAVLTTRISAAEVGGFGGTTVPGVPGVAGGVRGFAVMPPVGAWRLLAPNLNQVSPDVKSRLNAGLLSRSQQPRAIPVTGQP
jgi:hypothetical protein